MRICLISKEYPPDTGWGGIGAYTFQIAHGLKEIGHDVEVVALAAKDVFVETKEEITNSGIHVHRAVWNTPLDELKTILISVPYSHYVMKTNMSLWRKFDEVNSKNPFDVVEAPEHLAEGLMLALTKSTPLVLKLHTPHSKLLAERFHNLAPNFDQQFISMLERMAMLKADVLISPSKNLASYVSNDLNYPQKSIAIVSNPINANQFHPEGNTSLDNSTDKNGNKILTVLFVGRLEERKGVHYLIEAIPQVVNQYENVRFVMVGSDTNTATGKKSVLTQLKANLQKSGCIDKVTFISKVPLSEMPSYYRAADICIAPSLYDNAPYTCLEAMSCGKPFIGTDAGGMPEYVINGESGLIVPHGNAQALAYAILKLLKSESDRITFGKNARVQVVKHFHRTEIARQNIEIYQLAQEKFKVNAGFPLYRKGNRQFLNDTIDMLYAYHTNMYQFLYLHSLRFRIRHWTHLAAKRPKLLACKILLATTRPVRKHLKMSFLDQLAKQVQNKEEEREQLVRKSFGCSV